MFYHTPQGIPGDTCCWLRFLGCIPPQLPFETPTQCGGLRSPCNNLNTGKLHLLPGTIQLARLGCPS